LPAILRVLLYSLPFLVEISLLRERLYIGRTRDQVLPQGFVWKCQTGNPFTADIAVALFGSAGVNMTY
jgi:hypothetical protein